jgi:hypothetical protein
MRFFLGGGGRRLSMISHWECCIVGILLLSRDHLLAGDVSFTGKLRLCNSVIFVVSCDYVRNGFIDTTLLNCRSRWPRGLRRGYVAVRLLGLRIRIPPGARMSVSCEFCVLSGRGLCDGPITRPEESYRVWFVWVNSQPQHWEDLGPLGLSKNVKNVSLISSLVT